VNPVVTTSPRVLIIEDDPNVSEVVARYLDREGYLVLSLLGPEAELAEALPRLLRRAAAPDPGA